MGLACRRIMLLCCVVGVATVQDARAGYLIRTVAGTGATGCTGDGGPATSATLGTVRGLAIDQNGQLLMSDNGCETFRRVDLATGTITTVAGAGTCGFQDGALAAAKFQPGAHGDFGIDLSTGRVYTADSGQPAQTTCTKENHRVRVIDFTAGQVTTLAGDGIAGSIGDGGLAMAAELDDPHATTFAAGKVYIADTGNNRVRVVDLSTGIITNFAGTGIAGFEGDGGPATAARLQRPHGVVVDSAGNVVICDDANNRIRRVAPNGTITTIAGTGSTTFNGDFIPATQANLNGCEAVAIDQFDNLYITQFGGERIRRINRQGIIATIGGTGTRGDTGEGGNALLANIAGPVGIWVDSSLRVYFSEYYNNKVKRLEKTNTAPTSNAGPDQFAYEGRLVTLDGLASRDPENDSLAFTWTQTAGPAVVLASTAGPHPTFLAPSAPATLTFSLVVRDDQGLSSGADSVTITVGARSQVEYRWRSSTGVDLAAQNTAAATTGGTQLHLRVGVAAINLPWILAAQSPTGEVKADRETVTNTFAALAASDGTRESLVEGSQGGINVLGNALPYHQWTFGPSFPPTGPEYEVCFESFTSGESFDIGWSPTATPGWPGWRVTALTQTPECFDLSVEGYRGGPVSVFAQDDNRQTTDHTADTFAVDVLQLVPRGRRVALERDTDPAFSAPVAVAASELWDDTTITNGSVLAASGVLTSTTVREVAVETRPSLAALETTIAAGGQGEWDFAIVAPNAAATYHYRVVITDELGNRLSPVERQPVVATLIVGAGTCGDGIAIGLEQCDTGGIDTAACNGGTCTFAACGDGYVNTAAGEQCDSSGADTASCNGGSCLLAVCGDGHVNAAAGEQCDSSGVDTASCNGGSCLLAVCGDGYTNTAAGETCDGGGGDTASCNAICTLAACGDGYVNAAAGEQCDSSGADTATCNGGTCSTSACGDGYLNAAAGEQCDSSGTDVASCNGGTCTTSACGDGYTNAAAGEQCDGNGVDTMTCNGASCTLTACGDGHVNAAAGEQCDSSGADVASCNGATCTSAGCGDGYLNAAAGEECDSNGIDTASCNGGTCVAPACGDGYLNEATGEQCDTNGAETAECHGATCTLNASGLPDGYRFGGGCSGCRTTGPDATLPFSLLLVGLAFRRRARPRNGR